MAKKPKYTKQQREQFYQSRIAWSLMADPGKSGTAPTEINSYAIAGSSDPTDPNAYTPPADAVPSSWPEWAKPPKDPQSDAMLASPLPTGKSLQTLPVGSPEALARQQRAGDALKSPQEFMDENVVALNKDQTLIDKGFGFLEGLFNYEDEGDLQVFGIPMGAVESAWDNFNRYFTGGRNLLDIGIGGIISAMPGGIKTLSYDELSGNHDVGSVLHGDIGMLDNNAPSPMQIAIASVAVESKRIREGGARLSDVLLLNPAIAPFILAGIKADTSPLQKTGFNIMDKEQRKAAFSQGYEQWFSGIGDFGVQMADPTIALTASAKILSLGMLGMRRGRLITQVMDTALPAAFDNVMAKHAAAAGVDAETYMSRASQAQASSLNRAARKSALRQANKLPAERYGIAMAPEMADDFWSDMDNLGILGSKDATAAKEAYVRGRKLDDETPDDMRANLDPNLTQDIGFSRMTDDMFDRWHNDRVQAAAKQVGDVPPRRWDQVTPVTKSSDELGLTHPLERFINDVLQVDESGKKVMTAEQIMARKEFRRSPNKAAIPTLLHSITDPYILTLTLQSLHGSNTARESLAVLRPAISDAIYHAQAVVAVSKSQMDPTKVAAARQALMDSREALVGQRTLLDDEARISKELSAGTGTTPGRRTHDVLTNPDDIQRRANYDQSIDELDALIGHLDGRPVDLMVPGDFYDPKLAEKVISDMYIHQDTVSIALQRDLKNAMLTVDRDARFITNDNWYARLVSGNRERSARARYEYSVEGSGLMPKRVIKTIRTAADGSPLKTGPVATSRIEWGWVSGSEFGTNRLQRAARVWRWMGTETPAGYVGLKGSALMGSENELAAVLDVDLYRNAPVEVTYWDKATGTQVTAMVGGAERKAELMGIFLKAVTDPNLDPKSALVTIERSMEKDFGLAYGVQPENMRENFMIADKRRANQLAQTAQHGMFVDPDTRAMHHVPYLKTQLANGQYMHNWHQLESNLQRIALNNYGAGAGGAVRVFRKGAERGTDVAKMVDSAFQSLWRPAVLFRMSYTQRNIFEGMTRSMAYYGSLAPLLWPIQSTYHGLSNVVRKSVNKKVADNFVTDVAKSTVFKDVQHDLLSVSDDHHRLASATPPWMPTDAEWAQMKKNSEVEWDAPIPTEPVRITFRRVNPNESPDHMGPKVDRILTPEEWDSEMALSYERLAQVRQGLEPLEDELDKIAGKSKFGKWREQNITGLRDELCQAIARRNLLSEMLQASPAGLQSVDTINEYLKMSGSVSVAQRNLDTLRYDPTGSIQMWRGQADRAKRIGSGSSIGPDGGTYGDAFADEFEAINRGLLSSDTARKMSLGSANDGFTSILRSQYVKENVPVDFVPGSHGDWSKAMAQVIETNAWNPVIRVLVRNDMNVDSAVEWMLRTPEGREFALYQRWLEGSDFENGTTSWTDLIDENVPEVDKALSVYQHRAYQRANRPIAAGSNRQMTVDIRLRKLADQMRDPVTGHYATIDHLESVLGYATHAANALRRQMQEAPQFMALQARRALDTEAGSASVVTVRDVENAIETLTPEQYNALGAVQGDVIIESGTPGLMDMYRKTVDGMFRVIGTIPEDAAVRGPFYNKRFKQVRNDLIMNYWDQNGGIPSGAKSGRVGKGGKVFDGDLTHPEFKIAEQDLQEIIRLSHRQALFDTREYLYTIERRTNLGKYGEYIWPFISAQQNTVTAGGKLLFRNPWVAPVMYDLWATPQRLGVKDDEGNLTMPMPFEWVKGLLQDASNIPVIGGVLSGTDMMTLPANGINVWAPDTGFGGIIPRPSALIQMTASNLMQWGLFPIDTPSSFTSVFGEEKGKEYYGLIKDYMFGEDGSMSTKPLSWDIVVPPWMRRILDSRDEMSDAYAYHYQLEWAAQGARALQGERDWPTSEDINKRVTNKFWFYAFGNFGVPTPLTPYPILTRPDVQKPLATELQGILQMYQAAQGKKNADGSYAIEPGQAYEAFARDFGEDLLPLAMSGTSLNVGGAQPTEATIADIKAYDSVIRNVAPGLGEDIDLLDILVNNSNGAAIDYSDEAYRYEKITQIPGIGDTWRKTLTGSESTVKRNKDAGWTEFSKFTDKQTALMAARGLTSLSQAAAKPFRDQKDVFLINMSQSNLDWYTDYLDGSVRRIPKTISLLSKMVGDPTVQRRMMDLDQQGLYAAMHDYLYYRQQTAMALEQAGDDKDMKDAINTSWETIQFGLSQGNARWHDIQSRWLDNDTSPQYASDQLVAAPVGAATEGVTGG